MGTRELKKQIFSLLKQPDIGRVLSDIQVFPAKEVVNVLFSAICQVDELLRWHGISAMGVMVTRLADADLEEGRIIMRRLLWSLNDESGGIGWGAPESMAEIMHHHEKLSLEYIHMLISYARPDGQELEQDGNYLEYEILQRGLLWGFDRLCERRLGLLVEKGLPGDILPYLRSGDHVVRGLAARLCGRLSIRSARDALQLLLADHAVITFYQEGEFLERTVGDFAGTALKGLA
ncbi:MAG TPA: HEAT repeat domain-containing protein [Desulfobulbaceae bacterium]|nr:HEAT repeat domain-containing protein [Desulfobulbaceae bacterium]